MLDSDEMIDFLDGVAADLIEMSMNAPPDNTYDGRGNHPAYAKINNAADILVEAAYDLKATQARPPK